MESIAPFRTSEISRIEVGFLDSRQKRAFTNTTSRRVGGGLRSEITELSRQSRSRLLYKARNIPGLLSMGTFTYPSEDWAVTATGGNYMTDGKAVKEHLRKLRQLFTYRGIYGFWFLEFQTRGAPHFHFVLSRNLDESEVNKIRRTWARMVGTCCPHHEERGFDFQVLRKPHAASAYAAKYSAKTEQKTVPDRYKGVGRFWGTFGDLPKETSEIKMSIPEMYKLIRIARAAQKSYSRDKGIKYRHRDRGKISSGLVHYNTGQALRQYLLALYPWEEQSAYINVQTSLSETSALQDRPVPTAPRSRAKLPR